MLDQERKEEILQALQRDLLQGLRTIGNQEKNAYLLLYMDFGVVWGKIEDGELNLPGFSQDNEKEKERFSSVFLQQAHIFNLTEEVRVWCSGHGFELCFLKAEQEDKKKTITQRYLLWGSSSGTNNPFEEYREGKRGIVQTIPIKTARNQRVALVVNHRINQDDDGQSTITGSRLVDLQPWEVER